MDLEIGHINLFVKTEKSEALINSSSEDDTAILGWHKDSYPVVCVIMLSDCTSMIRGEIAIRTGIVDIMKLRRSRMLSNFLPIDILGTYLS